MAGVTGDDLAGSVWQRGGLAVADDARGTRLSLLWSGLPPWSIVRFAVPLIGLAVIGAVAWWFRSQWFALKAPLPGQHR